MYDKYRLSFQGVYVTEISEGSAASNAGLMVHDKILQCNGYDFTMVSFDNMNGKADLILNISSKTYATYNIAIYIILGNS